VSFPGLAAALAERLAPHVPAGVAVSEEPEGFLRVALDESRWEVYPLDEPELAEEIDPAAYDPAYPAFAVLEALDFLQEYLHGELEQGWETGEPWAEQDEDEIRLGFAGGPSLEPIPLTALGE
jgi:hypothetical protein